MNLYLRELKAHRKSMIIWSAAIVLLIVGGMGKYSAASAMGSGSINELISKMPPSLQNLFGVGVFDLSKAIEYFGVLFIYITLVAAIHAVMLGAGIIAKEERDKTAEFLMTKPVSRYGIVNSKLIAALTLIFIFNMIISTASFAMISYYSIDNQYVTDLLHLMLALFAIQIIFTALGAFCASLINKPKLSSAVSTGILLTMFIIYIITDISEKLDFLRYITIFKYFDAKDILKKGFDIIYLLITLLLLAVLISGTYMFYNKRDLRI